MLAYFGSNQQQCQGERHEARNNQEGRVQTYVVGKSSKQHWSDDDRDAGGDGAVSRSTIGEAV
jgi:hypothetical protein